MVWCRVFSRPRQANNSKVAWQFILYFSSPIYDNFLTLEIYDYRTPIIYHLLRAAPLSGGRLPCPPFCEPFAFAPSTWLDVSFLAPFPDSWTQRGPSVRPLVWHAPVLVARACVGPRPPRWNCPPRHLLVWLPRLFVFDILSRVRAREREREEEKHRDEISARQCEPENE